MVWSTIKAYPVHAIPRAEGEAANFKGVLAASQDPHGSSGATNSAVGGMHDTLANLCLLLQKVAAPLKLTAQVEGHTHIKSI